MSSPKTPPSPRRRHIATDLVHAGREPAEQFGFVNTPIYRGSTVLYPTADDLANRRGRFSYGRRGTPTSLALESALKQITGGAGVVLTPSGLSAASVALLSVVKAGDHILMTDSVYEPTRHVCDTVLARLGVTTQYFDPLIGAGIAEMIRPATRLVYCEAPGSQTFEMGDIPAMVEAAHARDALVAIDNTWATSLGFDGHSHGVDLVIEAGTKYLGGHADVNLGFVSAAPSAWKSLQGTHGTLGQCAAAEDIFLALRGLRTLALRLQRHQASALEVCDWLAGRPEVSRILNPMLPTDPGHALFKRDFTGGCGLFSIVLKPAPREAVAAFLDALELFGMGYSWGGYESLAIPFDAKAYRTATSWQPEGPTLRFHIGLDEPADLIDDLERGFAAMANAASRPEGEP
ncbi:cystathionine beta-lyase [Blastochloris viridis]|uniref:Cystathionine beta-lyase n=1 Tax=Blastochloris viridis TaxID=1079 RepID=A0A0H5BF15_BLAVI|nr:cystathionine beta-lyase [Blastochloris viridis]ALK09309.1 Cystathionine beta-lyase MetC [Blastochloris viridis]BAS00816.1 cystathionine beta-lyase [Blastochloris viridis]CUU41972.1 Cystathionine beta-lyase metC [Blastochloris viridis]